MPEPSRSHALVPWLGPRWTKVRRDLLQHKSRSCLVVLAIAIGLMGAGTVLDAWSLVRGAIRTEYAASNPPSATLKLDSIDAALLERVRALPPIEDAERRRTVSGRVRTPGGWRTAVLFAADDFQNRRIGKIEKRAGAWPPPDGAIVIETSSVEFAEIELDQSVGIELQGSSETRLTVAGIARDVGLAPGWMEHVVYGFVTPATLEQLGATPIFDELQIVVRNRASLDRETVRSQAVQVREVLEAGGQTVSNIDVPVPMRHLHAAQMDSLLLTQAAFGVLTMFLSGVLVVNLLTAMLASQVREIGIMKSIGARMGQLTALYLGLAFFLGLLACALALPLAAILGRAYARYTSQLLNFDVSSISIPRKLLLLQLAVGVLLPVLAAAIPVVRGCRISIADALRGPGIDWVARASNHPLLERMSRWPRPVLFAFRNAFRKRQRMALTVLALAAGGAVFVGALNLRASIRRSVDSLFDAQPFDLILRFEKPWPADRLEAAVRSTPGVGRVEAWAGVRAALAEPDGRAGAAFPLQAPPADTQLFRPHIRSGQGFDATADRGLLVNRRLLGDVPALALGNEVTLLLRGQPSSWRVVGIVETGPAALAYAERGALQRALGEERLDRVVVASEIEGTGAELDLVQRLRRDLDAQGFVVSSSQLMSQSRRVMEDHLLMVATFLGAMSQLMILVGGLALASTMSLAVLERTREIGVLRAIGARHSAIHTLVHTEGLTVGVLSWALALPLSIPVSVVLGAAFGRVMIPVPMRFVPEPAGVLQWLAVVVLVSLAACAWPAIRATRIPTAQALTSN